MRSTGNLQVNTAGIYTFALSGDEGGRLRIDGVDVIVDESFSGFANAFGSVSLTAGNHSFEWIGLEANGSAAFELSVAVGSGRVAPVTEANGWRILGSANSHAGISLQGSISTTVYYPESGDQNVTIAGNYIGTDATGTLDFGNAGSGVLASAGASGVTIGGSSATSRNLISGNNIGVDIYGRYTKDIWVAGNYIGVGANGNTPVGNSAYGVWINQTFGTILGTNGDGVNDAAEGNVISASGNVGVYVNGDRQVVHNLTIADQLISGKLPSTISSGTIPVADMNDLAGGSVGNWSFNHPVPGGGGDDYVFRAAGQITVTTPGVYTFGLGGDDGTRLRIDGVDVIVDDALHGFLEYFGTVNLTAGTHTFEWVGMERAWNAGWELTVKAGTHITGPANAANGWAVLGDAAAAVSLTGSIAVDVYYAQVIAGEHHVIAGNIIGLNSVGTVTRGNGWSGILIENGAQGTIIGTNGDGISDVLERNIISANAGHGVEIRWSGSDHSIVAGNYIGTDITGTQDFGNTLDGVAVWESARFARIGTNGDGVSDTVEGNLISGNNRYGVYLLGRNVSHNVVAGNLIGTDVSGTLDLGNTQQGVRVENGHSNRIGTDGSGDAFDVVERNVISGNNSYGVYIFGTGAHDNVVAGNLVGTNAAGTAAIENNSGVVVAHGARNTRVGTNADGSSDATERNIISGNVNFGLWLSNTTYTSVAGNYIGTNVTGTSSVANGRGTNGGVMINAGSRYNVIGTNGDGIGDAVEGNLISGNNGYNGLWIEGDSTHYNVVAGNRIGTDVTGTLPLANRGSGIEIKQGASYNRVGTNTDGVSDVLERNIISANQAHGVFIWRQFIPGGVPTNNTIAGNHIGTDITGTIDLGNSSDGVYLGGGATGNTIGGSVVGAGNLISGNNGQGVELNGAGTSNNIVAGNFVGTNVTGTAAVGNSSDGIRVSGSGNRIGGAHPAARNLVSGNGWNGINIDTTNAISNKVQGNYVGLNAAGTGRIANANHGVLIWGGAVGTIVGTNGDGVNDATEGNVISGNTWDEVSFWTGGANQTVIAGNLLGTTADGLSALTRNRYGVWVTQGALNTRVGTNADGVSDELERNIISGGGSDGVRIDVAGVANTTVAGNYIGTDITGTVDFGNAGSGVWIGNSANNTIGGSVFAARNVISGNNGNGVFITGATSTGNRVLGNYIGLNASGTGGVGNTSNAVSISAGANNNTIGGSVAGARNVISGSLSAGSGRGVLISGAGTSLNTVKGNFIGLDATGMTAIANANSGVLIGSGATNNTIGGPNSGDRNVISGNVLAGIAIQGSGTTGNVAQGNWVGINASGTAAVANLAAGIAFIDSASANSAIGNVVSGNAVYGIGVHKYNTALGANNNIIRGNLIGTDPSGTVAIPNVGIGVSIGDGSSGNIVGGTTSADRNVISGNTDTGIKVNQSTTANNVIQGNYIGITASGATALGNGTGVHVISATGTVIGGAGAGNVISGNGTGILVESFTASPMNTGILGNFIGTNAAGTAAIGNAADGVDIRTAGNTIGGTTALDRNIISGNAQRGISISGAFATNNTVIGSYIGTDLSGTVAIPNSASGIIVSAGASSNTIGGTTIGAGNLISGNAQNGVYLIGAATIGNIVHGNYIGTNAAGTADLGNALDGIRLIAPNNTIGGTTAQAGNVISGNDNAGLWINSGANNTQVSGNLIGTNASGSEALGNTYYGIHVQSNFNQIGGSTAAHRNVVSGTIQNNGGDYVTGAGIAIYDAGFMSVTGNVVRGNYIGTDITGSGAIPNFTSGVTVQTTVAGNHNTIGGSIAGEGNLISGNGIPGGLGAGIYGNSLASPGFSLPNIVSILGNYIGTNATGSIAVPNRGPGIYFYQSPGNIVGGSSSVVNGMLSGAGNLISGNLGNGIHVDNGGSNSNGTVIQGNFIGTDLTGTQAIGNAQIGVATGSSNNIIGSPIANQRNVISGNTHGVSIGSGGTNNQVFGNYIGTDVSGLAAIQNTAFGVWISSAGNSVGGTNPQDGNIIANSGLGGLRLEGVTGNNGTYSNNTYHGNLGLAIDAGTAGRTLNALPDTDGVLNYPVVTSTQIVGSELIVEGTMTSGKTVEIYISAPTADGVGQGRQRLASALDNSLTDENATAGQFKFRIPLGNGLSNGTPLTALTIGSTSEFSPIVFAGQVGSFIAPQITLGATTVSLTSGNAIGVDGSFYDPDSVSWGGTVDYGDGSRVQPLTLNSDNTFRLEHTYVNTGSFIVTVQIRDNSLISSTKSLGVTVQNEAPTASFDEFSITSPASEGQLVTLTGRFEDTGGTHTATIEWGDGSTSILPLGLGIRDFSATHTYHDDSNSEETATPSDVYRVVVTITDESGESDLTPEGLFLEEIINVLPSAMNAVFSSTSITEGQAVTLSSLFFVDPGQLDAHTLNVNWGDGSEPLPITLPLGTRSLADLATLLTPIQLADLLAKLTHIYADDANIGPDEYTITVEVADDDEPQQPAVITKVISVANAIPSAVLASISSTQIQEDGLVSLSGSFFDLGLLDDYVVTIDWGDGTTVSTFPLGAGITTFSGMSHQYINNRTGGGNYAIEVRVMDNDSPTLFGLATASIHVENVAPVLGPLALSSSGNAILEGDRLTLSGRFTDVSMQDRHTVLVNWGDGSVTPATVDAVTRTYTATHQYLDNNATPLLVLVADPIAIISYLPYSISVTVDDHDGGTATATIGQDVYNVAPTVTIEPGLSNTDRNLINLVAGIEDPGTLDTFTHGGAYRWTAEVVGIPGTMQSGSVSTFVVDRTAYPDALWNVSLSVADDDGGTGSFTTTLLVGTNGDDIGANRLIVSDAMFSQSGTFNLMALGLDGNDTIDASGVTDPNFSVTLVGGSGVDNMFGGAGDDVYLLAQGNDNANVPNSDVLNPVEAGSDRYVLRPNSVLTVIDRIGSNSLDFGLADFGITFDLSLTSTTTLVSQDVVPIPMTAPLHIVQTQGSFTRLDGSLFDDHLTAASGASLFGDAGNDTFTAKAGTIGASFHGGADSDILSISAVGISNLDFSGDAGADTLINLGEITGLTFNGGADADILQNDGSILAALSFGGDAGADLLLNSGDIANLTFNGGADNDIFVNNGTATTNLDFNADADILLSGLGSIGTLNFGGDSGADIFVNLGSILDLTFNGGADNDIFVNNGSAVDTLDFGGDLDVLLSGLGTIGELSFNGDAGIDTLINRGSVGDLTFDGGADSDILQNNGTILRELSFEGDAGIDTLINLGSVGVLTFDGGADADVLQNLGTVLGNLSFEGDFGADVLTNTGSLGSLTFRGGADSDILQNNGTVLGALVFRGDAGVDTLLNQGTIGGLSFAGGADADVLRNLGGGTIVRLDFDGDAGADLLVNLSSITHLTFAGGADADILQNIGNITDLNFGGDAGADLLVNSGSVTLLTFRGGADNDILVNTGNVLGQLTFGGHTGLDSLVNDGTLGGLTFNGGADSDILQNTGTIQTTLLFNGDTGIDTLINSGSVLNLTFNGGADSDLLMNTGTVLDLLVFTGDLGSDQLTNLGTVGDLTFNGGADADVLKNTGTILDDLVFNGDIGADLLINGGPIGDLTFDGGADNDVLLNLGSVGTLTFDGGADNDVLQNNGSGIYSLNFIGGADNDVLINNGNSIRLLTFDGGADNDVLVSNGTLIGILEFTGDTGVPVSGRTSNDTLIVRGSGSGAPTSSIVFNGGYGVDAFENNASGFATIVFNGGLDADALLNNASGLASLDFYGDAGADVFVNHGGAIVILDFNGGADADTLINDGLALGHLNFDGGADSDILINSGDLLETLTFNGGADADILLNQGGQLGEIQFDGGADADVLINDGPVIDSLEFNGDAGNDRLWNRKGGIQIGSIVFMGDAGIDTLINDAAGIDEISFNGGADADILQNNGSVLDLSFDGGADADVLVNAGFAGTLTFDGGADADILLNRGGQVDVLDFMGDAGIDTLFNLGPVTSLTFEGGSDADVLQNNAIVDSLSFYGDVHFANGPSSLHDGADTLVNNGPVRTLSFVGGADNDIFQNNASVVELTFDGGADADTLVNNGGGITTLDFNGDAGADTLINNGSGIQTLHFDGGADADALRIEGREVGKVTFNGGLGSDSFTYNGVGAVASSVHFNGGAGNDFFAMRGIASAVTFDGGYGDDGVLVVGSGAMSLTGGDGDDFYRFVSNPLADVTLTDSYSGVADVSKDSLDFSSFTGGPVTLDLRLVDVWQSQGSGQLRIRLLDSMAIENIVGTPFADTIFGNARSNYIGGADFDEAFSGPVAAPRGVTQWVFLDFDSRSNSGVLDTLTGLPDIGEHDYTVAERELIRQRVEAIYRGPDLGAPWFDVRVVTSTASIPSTFILSNEFATVYFNQTPATGRPGGLASEVDPGNVNLGGSAAVQINGLLGGVINNVDSEETIEGDFDAFKRDVVPVNETEVGASKPSATSDNFVKLSSKVAAHELAHLLGLRHQDSFGPIGSGVHDIPGASSYKPTYTGPSGGVETIDHLIGSPASIGSTRFNDLNNLFFGEREAIKLAFANSNPSQTTTTNFGGNSALALAAPLSMVTLAVPNTLSSGQNATKNLYVQLSSVLGQIEVDSATMGTARSKSDWYSFTGRAGELINIDVFSNSVGRFGTGLNGAMISDDFVDTIVRVYNLNGQLVQYYDGLAENDDIFEPTDSSLIDLLLPADGTYYIEVDSFHRYSDALGNPMNPLSPLNPANPNNILAYPEIIDRFMDSINDTDAGRYQLVMYKFRKSSSSDMTDTLKGFGGADVINGGPGDIFVLAYDLGTTPTVDEGSAFTRSIVVDDRGASNWIGSTVDYGDGTGTQALSVSPSGVFSLNHVWADNGSYMVSVNIVNDIAQTLSHRLNVLVENVAPTASLSLSGPSTVSTETSITVSSTTSDPAGANDPLVLSWVITRNGEAFATQATGATYTFTPSLAGIYLIRLSATDGDGGTATATITVVSTTNAAPSLAITTPIDGAFGVSSSFTFNATDADVEDQAGTFVYAIQWGDGTTQTVSGPRLISVSHTYPAVSATGVFSIAATATDARGATSVLAKADFAVLGWTLMADPLHPSEAMLVIVGSQDSDSIKVKTKDDNYYKVSIRDRDDDVKRRGTVYGDVKRILVFAHGGNDRVTIEDDVEFTAEVWGGAGDDDIKGGSGNDILMGESGNDNLWGGNGRDIVIGGTGADRIHGDANDDILIAGFTAFEREFYQWAPSAFAASTRLTLDQQRAALESIMVEWASSRSYADRRNNIRGSGTGARLNGNDFLKMSDTVMTNNTVFDDSSVDQLWGDSGSDWFFANWNNDLGSVLDQIKDSSGSESQEDIDRWW